MAKKQSEKRLSAAIAAAKPVIEKYFRAGAAPEAFEAARKLRDTRRNAVRAAVNSGAGDSLDPNWRHHQAERIERQTAAVLALVAK